MQRETHFDILTFAHIIHMYHEPEGFANAKLGQDPPFTAPGLNPEEIR